MNIELRDLIRKDDEFTNSQCESYLYDFNSLLNEIYIHELSCLDRNDEDYKNFMYESLYKLQEKYRRKFSYNEIRRLHRYSQRYLVTSLNAYIFSHMFALESMLTFDMELALYLKKLPNCIELVKLNVLENKVSENTLNLIDVLFDAFEDRPFLDNPSRFLSSRITKYLELFDFCNKEIPNFKSVIGDAFEYRFILHDQVFDEIEDIVEYVYSDKYTADTRIFAPMILEAVEEVCYQIDEIGMDTILNLITYIEDYALNKDDSELSQYEIDLATYIGLHLIVNGTFSYIMDHLNWINEETNHRLVDVHTPRDFHFIEPLIGYILWYVIKRDIL